MYIRGKKTKSQYGYIPHINIIGQQNKQDNQYSTLVAGFGKG